MMKSTRMLSRRSALIAAGALSLAACSGSQDEEGSASNVGPVSLRMTVWTANEEQLELFNTLADEYMDENAMVESITFDALPFADYATTLTTQIAGGTAPDLAWLGDIYFDLQDAGGLAPLSAKFQEYPDWNYDDLIPSLTEKFSSDDELYAYPFSSSPFALYVNKDLLAQAGQSYEPADLNWEKLSEIAAAVNQETGKGGFVVGEFDYSNWTNLSVIWRGWGAEAWDDEGRCGFTSPEMTEAFTFIHNAIFENGSMPGPGTTADFFAGDAAFTLNQVSRAGLLDGSFEYDIHPLPAGPAGSFAVQGQAGIGVLQAGENVDAAVDFLAFMTRPDNSERLAQFFPPPRDSQQTGEVLAEFNETLSAEQLQEVVVDQLPKAIGTPARADHERITQEGRVALDPMWNADADVPGVLSGVCSAIEPLLNQ